MNTDNENEGRVKPPLTKLHKGYCLGLLIILLATIGWSVYCGKLFQERIEDLSALDLSGDLATIEIGHGGTLEATSKERAIITYDRPTLGLRAEIERDGDDTRLVVFQDSTVLSLAETAAFVQTSEFQIWVWVVPLVVGTLLLLAIFSVVYQRKILVWDVIFVFCFLFILIVTAGRLGFL